MTRGEELIATYGHKPSCAGPPCTCEAEALAIVDAAAQAVADRMDARAVEEIYARIVKGHGGETR